MDSGLWNRYNILCELEVRGESISYDNAFWYHVKIPVSFSYPGGRCNIFSYSIT